jgi:hypothetical protein
MNPRTARADRDRRDRQPGRRGALRLEDTGDIVG